MSHRILIPKDIASTGKDYLLQRGYELKILQDQSISALCEGVRDCDAVLARFGHYPAALFDAAENLKIFAKHGVGYDDVDLSAAKAHGVMVTNTPLANVNSVSEHTIAMMLACAQNLVEQDRRVRAGEYWSVRNELTNELGGAVLGLVGFGNIARDVAKKAYFGFDMKVLVYNHRTMNDLPHYIQQVPLDELLSRSDYVSLHCPATPATFHMIDAAAFHQMKPSATLINFARGSIVDEAALYAALTSGEIAMAGLDCFEQEPVDPNNPLFQLKNVICLPHSGGLSKKAAENMSLHAAMCIDDFFSGKRPRWVVLDPCI